MTLVRRAAAAVSVVLALTAAAGCSEDTPRQDGPVVLQPGEAGEGNKRVDPDQVEPPADEFNDVDREFVEMMVPHHHQAVLMAELAKTRAKNEQVAGFAQRIGDTQKAEIDVLQAWLAARDLPKAALTPSGEHATHMAGMLTPEQLDELAAAKGTAFDKLFVERMIAHHQGAVAMADRALGDGIEAINRAFAGDVAASQTAEIERLRQIQKTL